MFQHPPPPPEPEPSTQGTGDQELAPIHEVRAYVAECLHRGSQSADIRKQLIALGYDADEVTRLIQSVQAMRAQKPEAWSAPPVEDPVGAGKRNMLIGGVVCVLGVLVTCGSLAATSHSGGGGIIAYGAIIWGAIQFFRGVGQFLGGQES